MFKLRGTRCLPGDVETGGIEWQEEESCAPDTGTTGNSVLSERGGRSAREKPTARGRAVGRQVEPPAITSPARKFRKRKRPC